MDEYIIVKPEAREYRCNDCKQLRYSPIMPKKCGNCDSSNITIGLPGSLPT